MKQRKDWRKYVVNVLSVMIAIVLFSLVLFRTVIGSWYKIPTGSMIPTLKIGDIVLVSKISANFSSIGPNRGDVIVFTHEGMDFVKRVVGVAGEEVALRNDVLFVNGVESPRSPITDRSVLADVKQPESAGKLYREHLSSKDYFVLKIFPHLDNFGPVKVPAGNVFVLGDNRDNSKDSRHWGFIDLKDIRGRVLYTLYSFDGSNFSWRWERFGAPVQ